MTTDHFPTQEHQTAARHWKSHLLHRLPNKESWKIRQSLQPQARSRASAPTPPLPGSAGWNIPCESFDRAPTRRHVEPERTLGALRDDAEQGCQGAGPGAAEGAGRKPAGEAGRAERRGGPRGARGRGGPSVLWDAAVEWRWARDFEQTRVCVSEAPPPPRLLGGQGARGEKEAAAPPALVSVSPPGWGASGQAGGKGGAREGAPDRPLREPGLEGSWRRAGTCSLGGRRAPSRGPQEAGGSSGLGPFPPALERAAVTRLGRRSADSPPFPAIRRKGARGC